MSHVENVIDAERPATDQHPFVSVIIPVRNEAAFIARTLDRILNQDYPQDRLEVIVADGMSDDGTREILEEYEKIQNKYFNFKAASPKPDKSKKGLEGAISKFARIVEIVVNGIVGLLEIALEALKTLPFAFRLFGNIFAGEVLLFVVSYLFLFIFPIIFLGLELFVGLIQALIFSMLTLVFFSMAATSHHGDESHH